ncbi:uncharacterized protein METZ01_LOCUS330250, partial [marine metagenome]
MKILAVDDDHAVRVSLKVMFRKWSDVLLEVAEEAESAMEMLSEQEYLMMFCDVDMPGMNGLELLEVVREKYPAMPVVMLTGNQDITTPIKAFRSGAMDYLQKPMQTATVRETIDKAFEVVEKEAKEKTGIVDIGGFREMVEHFSPDKMGLDE